MEQCPPGRQVSKPSGVPLVTAEKPCSLCFCPGFTFNISMVLSLTVFEHGVRCVQFTCRVQTVLNDNITLITPLLDVLCMLIDTCDLVEGSHVNILVTVLLVCDPL